MLIVAKGTKTAGRLEHKRESFTMASYETIQSLILYYTLRRLVYF